MINNIINIQVFKKLHIAKYSEGLVIVLYLNIYLDFYAITKDTLMKHIIFIYNK